MRCLACDRRLNDREATRKYSSSGTFVDLCNRCFAEVAEDIPDIEGEGVTVLPDEPEDESVSYDGELDGIDFGRNDYDES